MKEHAIIAEPAVVESQHSPEVHEAHQRMLLDGRLRSRFIRLRSGARVHVIEAGDGQPVVLLHGSNTSSLSHVPFLGGLTGIRAVNVDRPGFGLSDPAAATPDRRAAVAFVDEAADSLGLDAFALAGGSMGGVWALWYALARPERVRRLALLGATPLLPGTMPPVPLRAMSARSLATASAE